MSLRRSRTLHSRALGCGPVSTRVVDFPRFPWIWSGTEGPSSRGRAPQKRPCPSRLGTTGPSAGGGPSLAPG